jgi:hypothetical protein
LRRWLAEPSLPKLEVTLKEDNTLHNSSSDSDSVDETTRELPKKKRAVHSSVSAGANGGDDNGIAGDSQVSDAGHILEQPKTDEAREVMTST